MGSDLSRWGSMAESLISHVMPKIFLDTNAELLKTLARNSEVLQTISVGFTSVSHKYNFELFFFYEELKTKLPSGMGLVCIRNVAIS